MVIMNHIWTTKNKITMLRAKCSIMSVMHGSIPVYRDLAGAKKGVTTSPATACIGSGTQLGVIHASNELWHWSTDHSFTKAAWLPSLKSNLPYSWQHRARKRLS
jgi:hypothetical protein